MRPAYYREQWEILQADPQAETIRLLSQRIASSFIDRYFYSDEYNEDYIDLICEMATYFDDPDMNQLAARALFAVIVERLCDDFEDLQTETYNRLICQVATYLRRLPQGARLDAQLKDFHLYSMDQLYQRVESIRLSPDQALAADLQPRKVLILSRVTIGADVAVTSVICQRAASAFPAAEIVVLGDAKLRQIMAPSSGVRIRELSYARHGGLIERFSVWLDLLAAVNAELCGLQDKDYLVLDPDSRLTQLGVLPLVAERNYRFFNSRGKQGYPVKGSISALTNLWLDNILGHSDFQYPRVWLNEVDLEVADALVQRLAGMGRRHIITLNLGVGGNARKRVAGDFELAMVRSLLGEPDTVVLLDMGFGAEETERSAQILAAVAAQGVSVQCLPFADVDQAHAHTRLFGLACSVGEIAALIARSHEFIGYDSACQHIGAALGVGTYTVFAGTSNPRFIRRWHACGPNTNEILYVDTLSREAEPDTAELLQRLWDLRQQ
jgi:ADP-heptose:LPS heptosyltransferase